MINKYAATLVILTQDNTNNFDFTDKNELPVDRDSGGAHDFTESIRQVSRFRHGRHDDPDDPLQRSDANRLHTFHPVSITIRLMNQSGYRAGHDG